MVLVAFARCQVGQYSTKLYVHLRGEAFWVYLKLQRLKKNSIEMLIFSSQAVIRVIG